MNGHERVRAAVEAALDAAVEDRERLLASLLGDDASLLAEARAMLAAHASADRRGFLRDDETSDRPIAPTTPPPIVERPGDRIVGRYKLLQPIGEGGFGVVFMAEQESPIRRRVALKVIKAGMDTRAVVARFEAERQALAMMDHPNIAKVFDGGTTDSGRPFFVMELVRGVPVTQFCDDAKLTTRQRVELLVPICRAVQHAHQKGVIHRDLKPSNVLVTLHDGRPVPKVIDFGIAKATGPSLTDKTLFTDFRGMIGTPAYMSPEQAEMSGLDVDTRSDVYSLGVLTYELLTGTTPFDTQRLVRAGLMEVQRILREEEPPRPSQRLSTMAAASRTTVAGQRGVEPARIGKLIAGELDWIVMRAMEKDRRRRYETASDLAADLSRYLAGEPIVAAPPSAAYRARKFARKHRGPIAVSAIVTAALAAGIVGTSWQWQQASARAGELQRINAMAIESMREISQDVMPNLRVIGPDGTPIINPPGKVGETRFDAMWGEGRKMSQQEAAVTLLAELSQSAVTDLKAQRRQAIAAKDAAELEAYIANLALAQAAMQADRWPEARERLGACPESKRGWEWRFLNNRARAIREVLHDRPAGAATSSESTLPPVTADGALRLAKRDAGPVGVGGFRVNGHESGYVVIDREGREVSTLIANPVGSSEYRGTREPVAAVGFLSSADRLVTLGGSGTARTWDARGRLLGTVRDRNVDLWFSLPQWDDESSILLQIESRWIVVDRAEPDAAIEYVESAAEVELEGKRARAGATSTPPVGLRVVSAERGGSAVRISDPATGREVAVFTTEWPVEQTAWSADGTRLLVRYAHGPLEIWDARPYAARQADRDARFVEIPAARAYVHKLLATDTPAERLKQAIRDDPSISTLRKLVAIEQFDVGLARRAAATTRP